MKRTKHAVSADGYSVEGGFRPSFYPCCRVSCPPPPFCYGGVLDRADHRAGTLGRSTRTVGTQRRRNVAGPSLLGILLLFVFSVHFLFCHSKSRYIYFVFCCHYTQQMCLFLPLLFRCCSFYAQGKRADLTSHPRTHPVFRCHFFDLKYQGGMTPQHFGRHTS